MKLFLSSLSIPNVDTYRSLFGDIASPRIAMICNAWGVYSPEKSAPYIQATKELFTKMHMTVDVIDLLEYSQKQDMLDSQLFKYDGIWVTGGNVYYLNWAIHQSGLRNIIYKHCDRGLVYGGESAGAIVAGPSLDHFQAIDDSSEAPTVILSGMGLTNIVIVPHYDNQKYGNKITKIYQEVRAVGSNAMHLNDNQALVIIDEQQNLV